MDMKFEVAVLPVVDVDRAKAFYQGLGWRLDADINVAGDYRVVQFTPPNSPASIQFGTGITTMTPGSAQGLYLIVEDVEAARNDLISHGADVSEVFHGGALNAGRRVPGPDPERQSYRSFASVRGSGREQLPAAGDHGAAPGAAVADRHRGSGRAPARDGRTPWRV